MRPPPDPRPFYKSLAPLLLWQQVARPVDWARIFGRTAPLELEIGPGNAEFLTREAVGHPERDYVAIEMRWASIKRCLRNLAKAKVANVRLVIEDARPVLERMFAPRSLARVSVLFPCPWSKERHERHRLFQPNFLRLLDSRLVDGGEVLLVTDWRPFLDWTFAQLPATGLAAEWSEVEPRYGTKYEKKWSSLGQRRFFEVRMRKIEHVDAPLVEDVAMNPRRLECFEPRLLKPEDELAPLPITFKEVVCDLGRDVVMVRVVVVEEPLTQQLWLMIAKSRAGAWWVTPARGCQMIPTAGTQRAIDRLAEAARATVATAPVNGATAR